MSASDGRWRVAGRWLPAIARWRVAGRWLPAIAWMAVIFGLSSVSGLRVSEEVEVDRPIRALAHLASYAFLAGLLLLAMTGLGRRPGLRDIAAALAIAVLYGLSDEIHQAFVPGRSGRVADVLIDALGAMIGLVIAWAVLTRRAVRRGGSDGPPAGPIDASTILGR